MKIPELVYHGAFRPKGTPLRGRIVDEDSGYVSTSAERRWAFYFSMKRRFDQRIIAGNRVIYIIDTEKLPGEVLKDCLPPDGLRPEAQEEGFVRHMEEELRPDRIRMQEWRFPYIPKEAIIGIEREYRRPEPDLSFDLVLLCMPE